MMRVTLIAFLIMVAPASAIDDNNFNSTECPHSSGVPTDADHLLCDDFEDGSWAVTCNGGTCCTNDPVCFNGGGTPNTGSTYAPNDGWEMEDNGPAGWPDVNNRTGASGSGFNSDFAAESQLNENGPEGIDRCYSSSCNGTCPCSARGEMGHNNLYSAVNELYVRWYWKASANPSETDYLYGQTKIMTLQGTGQPSNNLFIMNANGEAVIGGDPNDGWLVVTNYTADPSVSRQQNEGATFRVKQDHWYYIEWHVDMGTNGADGTIEVWADDCGLNIGNGSVGDCTGTPTRRLNYTNISLFGDTNELDRLWIENWSNFGAHGVHNIDQVVVSKSPIGFMAAGTPATASISGASITGGSIQ